METKDQFRLYFHDTDSQLVRVTDQYLPAIMNHRLFKDGSRVFSPYPPRPMQRYMQWVQPAYNAGTMCKRQLYERKE